MDLPPMPDEVIQVPEKQIIEVQMESKRDEQSPPAAKPISSKKKKSKEQLKLDL